MAADMSIHPLSDRLRRAGIHASRCMFKPLCLAGTLLLSLPPAIAEVPRMDALTISRSETGLALGCTQDKLCVEIAQQTGGRDLNIKLSGGERDPAHTTDQFTALSEAGEYASLELWPTLIRFDGGLLAGVETQINASYSGGGGGAATLHLIAFLPGQAPFEVLSIPVRTSLTIRACFTERDMKQRAGACHDEYSFDASLALTGGSAAGMPVLRYRSEATSFPGAVSRSRDSLAARPLRKRDIVTVTDRRCSYQRLYRFAPTTSRYAPDTPPPDCSDYTEP